jgi:hypothetical protein
VESFKIFLFIFITTWVCVARNLLSGVTRATLVDKLGYFISVFYVCVIDGRMSRCEGCFKFDILWPVPWLCSCFIRCYRNDISYLVIYTGFLVGGVIYCFCCSDTALCGVAENEHFMEPGHSLRYSQESTICL